MIVSESHGRSETSASRDVADRLATIFPQTEPSTTDGTLGQQTYLQLEQKILLGEWLPNTKVSLRTLALSLNTSMQPVREGLGRLVAASALEMTPPGRAYRVPPVDRRTVDEIWSMRLLLEGEAAALFAQRVKLQDARQLAKDSRALRDLFHSHDLEATMRGLMAWKTDLIRGAGSPILLDMVRRLYLRYAPFLAHCMSTPAPHDEKFIAFTLHIQDELVMAIETGDVVAARHLRCADILSFQRYLYGRIGWSASKAQEGPGSPPSVRRVPSHSR